MRSKKPVRGRAKGSWNKQEKPGHSPNKKAFEGQKRNKGSNVPKLDDTVRLNKFLANAGVCTRREADTIIKAGVVEVNGVVVSELGIKVNPLKDTVKYGGETLRLETKRYFLLNKPKDFVTHQYDLNHKRSVLNLVRGACKEKVFPVGRLDRDATGLILLTNDADLEKKFTHPAVKISQLFHVTLRKPFPEEQLHAMRNDGVRIKDYVLRVEEVDYVKGDTGKRELGIKVKTSKNNYVQRLFDALGFEIIKMDRVSYAGLSKKDLPKGKFRPLNSQEIINLKNL